MTTQVIQTKRSPAIWSVKHRERHRQVFSGEGARARAEAHAAEHYGNYEVRAMEPTGKEVKRAAFLAETAE